MRRVYPDAAIKPCPFCGSVDIHFHAHPGAGTGIDHRGETVYSMGCFRCGATFPNRYKVELLVEAWNTRLIRPESPVVLGDTP